MIKDYFKQTLAAHLDSFFPDSFQSDWVDIEIPKQADHGHFSTPISFRMARHLKKSPVQIAQDVVDYLNNIESLNEFCKCSAVNGFVNITLSGEFLYSYVQELLVKKPVFNKLSKSILLEYVSANPTGPLHIGHGRWAVLGDVMGRLLTYSDQTYSSEFYVNDAGNQIQLFYESVQAVKNNQEIPEGGYHGAYIHDLAQLNTDPVTAVMDQQKQVLASMGVSLDSWFSEKSLHESSLIDTVIDVLNAQGVIEKKDGAVWFKTTAFGDDKDRVLVKSDGSYTYFLVDIAYHYTKIQRGYSHLVTILGADHHGYVQRLNACVKALTEGKSNVELTLIIGQLVKLFRAGEPVRMSKRTGDMIALEDVIDEIGSDAVRYFLVQHSADTPIDFDLDLAKKQNNENPVYYIQYAHARMNSLLQKLNYDDSFKINSKFTDTELKLLHQCSLFYDVVWDATQTFMPYKLAHYIFQLARTFHLFYEHCPMKTAQEDDRQRRLAIVFNTKRILAQGLGLLGISAPDHM